MKSGGENLFELRRHLLSDARLQPVALTAEAQNRTTLVRAQIDREHLRTSAADDAAFLSSLEIRCEVRELAPGDPIERVHELVERTTQFNATGAKFSVSELGALIESKSHRVFTLNVRDRFGDHGLVGAAIIADSDFIAFVMSCRVIGLGVEQTFLTAILKELTICFDRVSARIVETPRNAPVRHLYRDAGFRTDGNGRWQISLRNVTKSA